MSHHGRVPEEARAIAISPHLILARAELSQLPADPVVEYSRGGFIFQVYCAGQSVWLLMQWPNGCLVATRPVYTLGFDCRLTEIDESEDALRLSIQSAIGVYHTFIEFPAKKDQPLVHWRTSVCPSEDLLITDWPGDLFPLDESRDPLGAAGAIHTAQKGPTGAILYTTITRPNPGSMFYLQNLTALNGFLEKTRSDPKDRISARWPELGFLLPTSTEHALPSGEDTVIGDAYILLSEDAPPDKVTAARLFLDLYADVYTAIPKPLPVFRDWVRQVNMTVRDLTHSKACAQEKDGHKYLLAYVGADDRPPESMVQLAVLLPMIEYSKRFGKEIPLAGALRANLPTFYHPDVKSVVRWLPRNEDLLGAEEHMGDEIMDSWYLYHTLMNLSRMALDGDAPARKLFLDSLDYAIKVARHFNYHWPVFYNIHNFDIIKAQAKPGAGGEHDVGAQYVHLMMQAYELTSEKRCLEEAECSAAALEGLGFDLGYQFNNTSFGAGGLLRLWRATGKELYRDLSYVCIANIVRNFWLWNCEYGCAKNYNTFLGAAPLRDAVYLALYEELEILAAFHDYLQVGGDDIPNSIRLLLCEYCKYAIDRTWYHYPGALPKEVLAEKSRSGHINPGLAIPLEDIYEGWAKAGQVGQQVYGAAAPFVFATRHCHVIEGASFQVHCNYPIAGFKVKPTHSGNGLRSGDGLHSGSATFQIIGDARCNSHVRIVPDDYTPLPKVTVRTCRGRRATIVKGTLVENGYLEYEVPGNAAVTVAWRPARLNYEAILNGNGKANSSLAHRKKSVRTRRTNKRR